MPTELYSEISRRGWNYAKGVELDHARVTVDNLRMSIEGGQANIRYKELGIYSAQDAPKASMSSVVGAGRQPMHTDGAFLPDPPRYLIFYCVNAGNADRRTRIWSINPQLFQSRFSSNLWDVSWLSRSKRSSAFYCPIFDEAEGQMRVRYDPICMQPTSDNSESRSDVEDQLSALSDKIEIRWTTGDMLIIDNWRCLHARSEPLLLSIKDPRILWRWTIGGS